MNKKSRLNRHFDKTRPPSIGTKEHIQWWRTWATFFSVRKVPNLNSAKSASRRVKSCFVAFPHSSLPIQGKKNAKNPSGTSRFLEKTSLFYLKVLWNFEGGPKIQTQKKKNHLPPFTGPSFWSSKASSCLNFCQKLQVPLGMFLSSDFEKNPFIPNVQDPSISPISFCGKRKRKIEWLHGYTSSN